MTPNPPQVSQSPVTSANIEPCAITLGFHCHEILTLTSIPQIIDGRYHTGCGHFYSMSTLQKDCGQNNCLFSSRHTAGCKASSCIQKMAAPTHNPIRISPTICGECLIRAREGTGTLGVNGAQNQ